MPDFDLFRVNIGGIDDNGLSLAKVRLSYWDPEVSERHDVEVHLRMKVDLNASLRELREQAKGGAVDLLRTSVQLLEQSSTDELHRAAMSACEDREARNSAELQEHLAQALSKDGQDM